MAKGSTKQFPALAATIQRLISFCQLFKADLSDADLSDADLRGADLSEANGVTNEQLSAAKSLEGATMPNGQKYEDWVKSRGQENSGSQ